MYPDEMAKIHTIRNRNTYKIHAGYIKIHARYIPHQATSGYASNTIRMH